MSNFKTLIDNMSSDVISKNIISGNITATSSDHLRQFLISPWLFANPPSNKFNVFEKDLSFFEQGNFILDYFDTDILNLDEKNVDLRTNNLPNAIKSLLYKYVSLKKN